MRRVALAALLALSACSEPVPDLAPPLDRFYYPSSLALAPTTSGTPTLLVASSNFDLRYGPERGGSLIAVDPDASLGAADGVLTGPAGAAVIGSYTGQLALADQQTCPGVAADTALVASRYTRKLHQVPLLPDGALGSCVGFCERDLDPDVSDPYAIALACRADGARRTAVVAYLTSPRVGAFPAGTAWLSELDLDDPTRGLRTFALGLGPVVDMAYDGLTDRLYAVGRFTGLTAPLTVVGMGPCRPPAAGSTDTCPASSVRSIDLFPSFRGADLQSVVLSNPQAGLPRRAYVSARVYDADLAASVGGRPGFDIGGVILVLDLSDGPSGEPRARVLDAVDVGLGPGQLKVLPVRPGKRDLLVVASQTTGDVTVYDDETGAVARKVSLQQATGIPEAGRQPFGLAVRDLGATADVYVAAFDQSTVSVLSVPLDAPWDADLKRDGAGSPLRIGKERIK